MTRSTDRFAVFSQPARADRAPTPIVDLRAHLSWQRRLPGRLGTAALWLGSLTVLGPMKLSAVVLAGALATPAVVLLERGRRQQRLERPHARTTALQAAQPTPVLSRAVVAAELGVPEWQLFRARHASLCIVRHDHSGRIVALEVPQPALQPVPSSTDAHPVG